MSTMNTESTVTTTETTTTNNEATMDNTTETETTGAVMDSEDAATEQKLDAEADEKPPAWIDFCAALNAHAQALGLSVQTQKGFTKYFNLETGHKLYVAKQGKEVKRVDTTLPILGQDGTYPISKPNGKIECHVVADLSTVTAVLSQLADASVGKIRPAKRAPKIEGEVEAAPAAE